VRDNNTMNKKKQSGSIAKVAGAEIVRIRAGDEAKPIINTETPAARKKERKKQNDSRYGKIAMHRQ